MNVLNLSFVFGVFIQAVSSSPLEDLHDSIAKAKNETANLELSNSKLRAEIKDQEDKYKSNYQELLGAEQTENQELRNVTQQLKELELKLISLYDERDTLTNHSIPEQKTNLLKIESGLKWLKENLALLRKRSSVGDQVKCFGYLEEIKATERNILTLSYTVPTGLFEDKIKIAQLELTEAIMNLKKAQRTNDRLRWILSTNKVRFEQSLADLKINIEGVQDVVEKAKNVLEEFKNELTLVSKQVEELTKKLDDLLKKETFLQDEVVELKSNLDAFHKAVQCYNKIEQFAIEFVPTS